MVPAMTRNDDLIRASQRQGRVVALVIALAGLLAILAPVLAALGLPERFEMLFYFASLAAFFWALVVAVRLWLSRTRSGE